jgi:26S proteasome regulatory subunit N2
MAALTSAAGLVGFLAEPDPALRSFALHRLDADVGLLWPEISNSISDM